MTKKYKVEIVPNIAVSMASVVLNQNTFCNGHGKLEVSSMKLSDALQLIQDIRNQIGEDVDRHFELRIHPERDNKFSASIYEVDGIKSGSDKLWFSVEEVIV